MGIFDFFKDSGKKVQDEANMAVELQKAVESMGLNIRNLHVAFNNGTATVHGEAPSQKDRELALLVVGNHKGVEKVLDDNLTVSATSQGNFTPSTNATTMPGSTLSKPTGANESRMYTVKSGDTLSKIAKEVLGSSGKFHEIFEANQPMLKDPNEIYPGQVLRIPSQLS